MRKVVLKDGTIITNCANSTTSNQIIAIRDTYSAAGAVMDLVNADNASVIQVFDENDQLVTRGSDLVLIAGASLNPTTDGITVTFTTRVKTRDEIVDEQIAELQEAVIG